MEDNVVVIGEQKMKKTTEENDSCALNLVVDQDSRKHVHREEVVERVLYHEGNAEEERANVWVNLMEDVDGDDGLQNALLLDNQEEEGSGDHSAMEMDGIHGHREDIQLREDNRCYAVEILERKEVKESVGLGGNGVHLVVVQETHELGDVSWDAVQGGVVEGE